MDLSTLVEAAIKLGVIPAVALFLIVSLHLQNRQLIRDRKESETALLQTMSRIISDYQRLVRELNVRHAEREDKNVR